MTEPIQQQDQPPIDRALRQAGMADIARDVPVPGRAAVPAVLRPAAGDCGVILMHGSGGVSLQRCIGVMTVW